MSEFKIEPIPILTFDQQQALALASALEKGEFYAPVQYMTRAEFEKLYPKASDAR